MDEIEFWSLTARLVSGILSVLLLYIFGAGAIFFSAVILLVFNVAISYATMSLSEEKDP